MKKKVIYLLVGIMFVLSSCLEENDGYSLSEMWAGFGVLHETTEQSARIIMDNDAVLIPVDSYHNHSWNENRHDDEGKPIELGDRLFVNYTIIGDDVDTDGNVIAYYVRLNSTKKILMKDVIDITPENNDSIGNDPVEIKEVWMTDSLLNFKIKYWGEDQIHFINLVKQPGQLTENNLPVLLELRHNANSDSEYIPYAAYVSFKLNELEIPGLDSVQFVVNATNYEGYEFEYEGTYIYNNE